MRLLAMMLAIALLGGTPPPAPSPVAGQYGMVVSEQHYASQIGLDVLRAGGNAVDAAIAVAYALAVVDPCCGNVGGGGFMLVRMHDGRERVIDFRERAPLHSTRTMYLDAHGRVVAWRSIKGWLAVGVPGTVAGMEAARRAFATMPRTALMAPAIALARDGFVFSSGDLIPFEGSKPEGYSGTFDFESQANARAIFMPGGAFPNPGTLFRQPQLAHTLETIARDGGNAFYRGPIAAAIVTASRKNGGILTVGDFERYRAVLRQPLHCAFREYDIATLPPPSSGGVTLCEILNVIAPYPLERWGRQSARTIHYLTEAERRAYADRNAYLG